jgi:plasmid maintenance system antidote protein VapI
MDKVRRLIKAGASISTAITESLGMSVTEFAIKHNRPRVNMSQVVRGKRWPTADDIEALIAELGGSEMEWRELLHEAGRPVAKVG